MADSCQPAPWMLIGTCRGNVPSAILRYSVERDSPVRARTVFNRMIRSVFAVFSIEKIQSLSVVTSPPKNKMRTVRQPGSAFRHTLSDSASKAVHADDWRFVRAVGDAGAVPASTGRSWKSAYADLRLELDRMCGAAKACARRSPSSRFSRHKTWRFLLRRTAISIAVHDVSALLAMQDGRHCCADLVFLMRSHDVLQ